jgi:hypothetical protein
LIARLGVILEVVMACGIPVALLSIYAGRFAEGEKKEVAVFHHGEVAQNYEQCQPAWPPNRAMNEFEH